MARSRSDLHRKAAQAVAIKRTKACRHMHAPLVASAAVTVRGAAPVAPRKPRTPDPQRARSRPCDEAADSRIGQASARRAGRSRAQPEGDRSNRGTPRSHRRRTRGVVPRFERRCSGVEEGVLGGGCSGSARHLDPRVSAGPIVGGASTRAQCRVEIERQGPLLSVRVTLEPAAATTATPVKSEPVAAPREPVTIPTSQVRSSTRRRSTCTATPTRRRRPRAGSPARDSRPPGLSRTSGAKSRSCSRSKWPMGSASRPSSSIPPAAASTPPRRTRQHATRRIPRSVGHLVVVVRGQRHPRQHDTGSSSGRRHPGRAAPRRSARRPDGRNVSEHPTNDHPELPLQRPEDDEFYNGSAVEVMTVPAGTTLWRFVELDPPYDVSTFNRTSRHTTSTPPPEPNSANKAGSIPSTVHTVGTCTARPHSAVRLPKGSCVRRRSPASRIIAAVQVDGRALVRWQLHVDLDVAVMRDPHLRKVGLTSSIHSCTRRDYGWSRRVAHAILARNPHLHGLAYPCRNDTHSTALVLVQRPRGHWPNLVRTPSSTCVPRSATLPCVTTSHAPSSSMPASYSPNPTPEDEE